MKLYKPFDSCRIFRYIVLRVYIIDILLPQINFHINENFQLFLAHSFSILSFFRLHDENYKKSRCVEYKWVVRFHRMEEIFEKYRSSELFLRGVLARIQDLLEYNESRKSGSNIYIFHFKIFWCLHPLVLKSVLQTPLSAPILYYSLEIFSIL